MSIPEGNYLLVQAGKQLEHLTGGLVKAGFHEVVVNDGTLATMARRAVEYPDRPRIRISSTFFWTLASDFDLVPIPALEERARAVRAQQLNLGRDEGAPVVYRPMKVGQQVEEYVCLFFLHSFPSFPFPTPFPSLVFLHFLFFFFLF